VLTFFHWGIHAWAVYVIVGLSLAYFAFRQGLPLTIRSSLYPLIGDRIYGPIGHTVDVIAILGTLFGVATSLGYGVTQINAGLNTLFGIDISVPVQIILIAVITLMATTSVLAGLDKGIRRLSQINLYLALGLLAFVLIMAAPRKIWLIGSGGVTKPAKTAIPTTANFQKRTSWPELMIPTLPSRDSRTGNWNEMPKARISVVTRFRYSDTRGNSWIEERSSLPICS